MMNNLYKNAIDKIISASFTGDDGLDYVETLVALDALKSVEKTRGECPMCPDCPDNCPLENEEK